MKSFTHGILFLYCLTSFAESPRASHKIDVDLLITQESFLPERASAEVFLSLDSLPGHRKNTLSKLQDDDSISIYFHSQGCFHTTVSKILIKKQDANYVASLYDVIWEYVESKLVTKIQFTSERLLKRTTLTASNINDFIKFEDELNVAADGLCTTIDSYQFRSKYRNLDRTDGSCSWRGFNFLRKSFFGSSE